MPELRWTLLILGALFVVGLALWEMRRQRQARGQQVTQGREGERLTPTMDGGVDGSRDAHEVSRAEGRIYREPTLTLPEMHTGARGDGRVEPGNREPVSDPPVVELDEASLAGLKVDRQPVVDEFTTQAYTVDDEPRENPREDQRSHALEEDSDEELAEERDDEPEEGGESGREAMRASARQRAEPLVPELAAAATDASASDKPAFAQDAFAVSEPIVDWPDENTRRIIALRLVSGANERFAGRAVRLALAAEGFLLGKFDIFHKPGPDGRAVLSAASLTKPGTFALGTMDAQRFGGLSLFAVLPGPLSPVNTFDELLVTARNLNDRLRGALQDERGEPLTPVRSASLRESLSAAATAPVVGPPGAGAPGDASPG